MKIKQATMQPKAPRKEQICGLTAEFIIYWTDMNPEDGFCHLTQDVTMNRFSSEAHFLVYLF